MSAGVFVTETYTKRACWTGISGLVSLDLSRANPVCNCLGFLSRLIQGCRGLFRRVFALVFKLGWYNNIRVSVSRAHFGWYLPLFFALVGQGMLWPDSEVIFLSFLAGMSCPIRTYFGGLGWSLLVGVPFVGYLLKVLDLVYPSSFGLILVVICLGFRIKWIMAHNMFWWVFALVFKPIWSWPVAAISVVICLSSQA
ncbi:hypothetical protein H0E87_005431 [Populus deltoides]|uniref:Uncharacterized protein n=1 Tax=Populus deltoides TaxID=3696 RepID=A0A8T2ZIY9_POPDE|nr:hypothetical protein H0E87_005431 [Populus deltoides]